jgi:acetylornithine deacetylase/succinyl-diaminopimelate desuccinylase-like protein
MQVDPVELWKTKPFGRVIEEGYFKGRGADDDKGGLMTALAVTVAALL